MVNGNGRARSMKLPNGEPRPVPNKICAYLRRNFLIFDILIRIVCDILVRSNGAQSHENWIPWEARGRCMKKLAPILIYNLLLADIQQMYTIRIDGFVALNLRCQRDEQFTHI